MRRTATVLALAAGLILAWAQAAPASSTQAVSGSASGTATITFGVPPGSPPGAFDTEVDDGTYTTSGPLGTGRYHFDSFVFFGTAGGTLRFSGNATLTRSDGATLSGTLTGTVDFSGTPLVFTLDLTHGTGNLVSANLTLDGSITLLVGHPTGTFNSETFTVAGTVVANTTPPNKNACKSGGWHSFTDANGHRFPNQGQCVSWAVHETR